MNILIFPTDDRSGLVAMIHHYSKLGHKVFIPKAGTLNLNWKKIASWPSLLCKSSLDKTIRNIELQPFIEGKTIGEDYFLQFFKANKLYDEDISCQLVDLDHEKHNIDVFHTLRGAENYLHSYFDIANRFFPNAKWVSSTMNAWDSCPRGIRPKNVAKFIPANYQNSHNNVNNVNVLCTAFEKSLLDIDDKSNLVYDKVKFASFNHNFKVRHPEDYQLFSLMNNLLKEKNLPEIQNFGGNIRGEGADIRYSENNGITGNNKTLSPRQSYKLTTDLSAAVHFKGTDWGGGVFYYCLNSGVPIITTDRYVSMSNSHKFIINDYNAIVIGGHVEAANAIERLTYDLEYSQKLKNGMSSFRNDYFSNEYWNNWEQFVNNIT